MILDSHHVTSSQILIMMSSESQCSLEIKETIPMNQVHCFVFHVFRIMLVDAQCTRGTIVTKLLRWGFLLDENCTITHHIFWKHLLEVIKKINQRPMHRCDIQLSFLFSTASRLKFCRILSLDSRTCFFFTSSNIFSWLTSRLRICDSAFRLFDCSWLATSSSPDTASAPNSKLQQLFHDF